MIRDLVKDIRTGAIRLGLDEQTADAFAEEIVAGICLKYGGTERHIPKRNREAIHAGVARDYDGQNREQVCRRYGVSRATFYRIIGRSYQAKNKN